VAQVAEPGGQPTVRQATIVATELPSDDRGPAAGGGDAGPEVAAERPAPGAAGDSLGQRLAGSEPGPAPAAGDHGEPGAAGAGLEQQDAALADFGGPAADCAIADDVFCEVLEVTEPYRRANEERGLGLAVDAIEGGNPLVADGLGLDISLPGYEAYLAVSYFLRDGTVRHVRSGADRRWPAHAREFVGDAGLGGQQGNVEMVVAVASAVPLFAAPRPPVETATSYLAALRGRLAELAAGTAPAEIAASLVVITPGPRQPS
jgi:hypothetical protein